MTTIPGTPTLAATAAPVKGTTAHDAAAADGTAVRHEEYQYLDLVGDILANGEHRPDRYALPLHIASYHLV